MEYIICQICGKKVKRLYGRHLKSHGITSEEYKKIYNTNILTTNLDKKNTSNHSGNHMKTEKYKKLFSKKIKGTKNPNHKSNTSIIERQERSPFSKKFRNYSSITEYNNFINSIQKEYNTQISYYLNKGFTIGESKKLLSQRQCTFSYKKCIQRYGKKKGEFIFNKRQEKWIESVNKNGNLKGGFSKISQELFFNIDNIYSGNTFFALKNSEYKISDNKNKPFLFDFTDLTTNKIIEYNGDLYHANPSLFEEYDQPHPFRNTYSKEIWEKDKYKHNVAKENGFDILIVWDSDYKQNKNKILNDCVSFLKNN